MKKQSHRRFALPANVFEFPKRLVTRLPLDRATVCPETSALPDNVVRIRLRRATARGVPEAAVLSTLFHALFMTLPLSQQAELRGIVGDAAATDSSPTLAAAAQFLEKLP